jgi:two-component system, OmpR family, sensor kinase
VNAAVIVIVPAGATIPFHNIWVSLTLLYGFRLWRLGATVPLLVAVCLGSGAAMTVSVLQGDLAPDELAEVPMMASMFVAVVWHARRHQAALDALRRSTAREREFVRHASHQLRTPITVARGHVELVRAAAGDGQMREDAGIVIEELDRLARISDRLLVLAAAEHVDFIAHVPVDVGDLMEGTLRRWAPAADREWAVDVQAGGTVEGDAERLEAALDALIENAVKATDDGDAITLRARADGGRVVLEVSDSGIGVAPEHLDRIFDRFWTAARDPMSAPGTGLGLATVKAIAEAHGGRVEARARPGGGTTVAMVLDGYRPGEMAERRADERAPMPADALGAPLADGATP